MEIKCLKFSFLRSNVFTIGDPYKSDNRVPRVLSHRNGTKNVTIDLKDVKRCILRLKNVSLAYSQIHV